MRLHLLSSSKHQIKDRARAQSSHAPAKNARLKVVQLSAPREPLAPIPREHPSAAHAQRRRGLNHVHARAALARHGGQERKEALVKHVWTISLEYVFLVSRVPDEPLDAGPSPVREAVRSQSSVATHVCVVRTDHDAVTICRLMHANSVCGYVG